MRKLKRGFYFFLPVFISFTACQNEKSKTTEEKTYNYPHPYEVDSVNNYFGTEIHDPFQWMENEGTDSLNKWIEEENNLFHGYLSKIKYRDQIEKRLTKIWNYPKYSAPFKGGDKYFFYKNDGLQNQNVLYKMDDLNSEPEVILDPNTFSEDGTVALNSLSISKNGKYLAYTVSKSGSDWEEGKVRNVETGKDLDDDIKWIKFSGLSWKGDGFYYSRYDAPKEGEELSGKNEFHKVYYHKLGTPQSADVLIYDNPKKPKRNFNVSTTEEEDYMALYMDEGAAGQNSLMVKSLTNPDAKFIVIDTTFKNSFGLIGTLNGKLAIRTNFEAPKYKLVLVDPSHPAKENWETLIPEKEDVLQSVDIVDGKLLAQYMKDAHSKLDVYNGDGSLMHEVELPTIGSVAGFGGKKEDTAIFYTFTSFTYPPTIYRYNIEKNQSRVFRKSEIDFNPEEYETKQVFYKSKDGTKIPMFIVYKKGIQMDGSNPVYMYAYGGFNISLTPYFSISRIVFLEKGGIFALPNLRGGGEYGEEWHKAGMKENKQNVFDDFIAGAEYLIHEGYTSKEKLAIAGHSNGGLLIGAVMTQRPDLAGVALPGVGVMDMLRFQKFTIGWAWVDEYGSSDNPEDFKNLLSYSPYHNLDSACYPPTLVTTADHDDRVVPAHSFKFTARLQKVQQCNNPVMIRIETKAGHGAGKPTAKIIEEQADIWAFTMHNLGMDDKFETEGTKETASK